MISGMCASVQTELDGLFGQLSTHGGIAPRGVSAQAFSKARQGFSAELFSLANDHLLELAKPRIDRSDWHGLRPVAVDGTRLRVATRKGWRIEEAFKRLKHRLHLESVTGLNYLALQQDFGARILADNLHTLLVDMADPDMDCATSRPNRLYALGVLKPVLAPSLLQLERYIQKFCQAISAAIKNRCRIQPGRTHKRPPRKAKPHPGLAYKNAR